MALSFCSKDKQCGFQLLEPGVMNSLSQPNSSSTFGNREWKHEKVPDSFIGIFRSGVLEPDAVIFNSRILTVYLRDITDYYYPSSCDKSWDKVVLHGWHV